MPYYVLYRQSDGRAISTGTLAPENVAAGLAVIELAQPPVDRTMWDEATRTFIPIPPKQFVNRLLAALDDIAYADIIDAYQSLSAANKTKIRRGIEKLLGDKLMMRVGEAIAIKD